MRLIAGLTFAFCMAFSAPVAQAFFVGPNGVDDAYHGNKESSPFRTLPYALERANPGDSILIAPGVYTNGVALCLKDDVSLIGCGETRDDVVLSLKLVVPSPTTNAVVILSSSGGSVVSNLTITTQLSYEYNKVNSGPKSGVQLAAGTLVDCVVKDCWTGNGYQKGGGINLSGSGVVRDCLITNCDAVDSGGAEVPGEGIYMTGGLVERCVISRNGQKGYGSGGAGGTAVGGGGVYMTGGTMRNCLIYENLEVNGGSGVSISGGTLENCTIANNRHRNSSSRSTGLYVFGKGAVIRNNIVWGNVQNDGVTLANFSTAQTGDSATYQNNDCFPAIAYDRTGIGADPQFVDATNKTYALRDYRSRYSKCMDAGEYQEWMWDGTDLDGKPRLYGDAVDIGCYEFVPPEGEFLVRGEFTCDGAFAQSVVTLGCVTHQEEEGLEARWTLTRRNDGKVIEEEGVQVELTLQTGAWDVRMEATTSTGKKMTVDYLPGFEIAAKEVYVSSAGKGVFPYDTLENATPYVDVGFPLLGDGGTLYIDEGSYVISNRLMLSFGKGSHLVGLKGRDATSVRLADVENFQGIGYYGVRIEKAAASVRGLTFVGGYRGPYYSGAEYGTRGFVQMTANALVTNCVFRDKKHQSYGQNANALDMTSGTVVDCEFRNISAHSSGGAGLQGGVFLLQGGTLDRALVDGCFSTGAASADGCSEILFVNGSGATVKNSLFSRNKGIVTALFRIDSGKIVNCTFANNTNSQTTLEYTTVAGTQYHSKLAGLLVRGGSVTNCILSGNWSYLAGGVTNLSASATLIKKVGYSIVDDRDETFATAANHNVYVAPGTRIFRKPELGDFRLWAHSPALDAGWVPALGPTKEAVKEQQKDLANRSRLRHLSVDIGAYEYPAEGLRVEVR